MQRCEKCGAEIKYIATGIGISTACDKEKLDFVTENGFRKTGYLVHRCKIAEGENAETRRVTDNGKN